MPNVVDSLVLAFSLDPKGFTTGQKEVIAGLNKLQEESLRVAKQIEANGKRAGSFFYDLKSAARSLFVELELFEGAKEGIQKFVAWMGKLNTAEASLGRLSRRTGESVQSIRKWQLAVEQVGGSAQDVAGDISGLVQQFQNYRFTGDPGKLPLFNTIGVEFADRATGKARAFDDVMSDLVKKYQTLDPVTRAAFANQQGFSQSLVDLISLGPEAYEKTMASAKRLAITTNEDTDAAEKLFASLKNIENAGVALGYRFLGWIQRSGLGTFLDWIAEKLAWIVELTGGGSTPSSPAAPSRGAAAPAAASASGLPLKAGATSGGKAHAGTLALAASLDSTGLVEYFSAVNDLSHVGGKHPQGLAFDAVLKKNKSEGHAEIAAKIQAMLGADAFVLDEYDPKKRSPGSTGPHIHVQFTNDAAAQRYADRHPDAGNNSTSSTVNIQSVVVQTNATDADGTVQAFKNWSNAAHANNGAR